MNLIEDDYELNQNFLKKIRGLEGYLKISDKMDIDFTIFTSF